MHSLFNNFKRILVFNNAILEDMARMERALGGEYIFDRAFLETSVSGIASRVHHVAYNLNALTTNRYIPLYDRYQEIRTLLDDILSGNVQALAETTVLPLRDLGWEQEPLVGMDLVCLAELHHHPGMQSASGFVVTTEGTRALSAPDPLPALAISTRNPLNEVRAGLAEQLQDLLAQYPQGPFSVTVTCIDDEEDPVREIGRFLLTPCPERSEVAIVPQESDCARPLTLASTIVFAHWPAKKAAEPLSAVNPLAADLLLHCLEQIAQAAAAAATSLAPSENQGSSPFCLFVRPAPPAVLYGTVQTRAMQNLPFDTLAISAHLTEREENNDRYFLRRTHPFELVQSVIPPKPDGLRFGDSRLATDAAADQGHLARGSALMDLRTLRSLAETALLLERLFGAPLTVYWEMGADATCLITRIRTLTIQAGEAGYPALASEAKPAAILSQGGQMVQSGVAAGSVVHVTEEMNPADFPPGAVAVARVASPNLTPVLQRAAAIITEFGTAAGHLATVARELRIPAIFGVPEALHLLLPNTEVTVDAGETTIYAGIVDQLLRYGAREMDLSPLDREYRMLRRLLRFIMPLNLVNPEAPNFSPQGCRTFHDIIHFCHEKAVDELAHFQDRRSDLGAIRTRLMALGVPMDIRVLDIGGGITPEAGREPNPAQVLSQPFALFLKGLIQPQAWNQETASLGVRDILAGMPRSMNLLATPVDSLGANLAIVGRDYINISLRLGYHFSVIDAHLGEDSSRNYVYFRFAGGLADKERRQRRAQFISQVLAAMDFKVTVKGDLVIGRLKLTEPPVLHSALVALGALTAFSRQRDTGLYSDADTSELFRCFADTFLGDFRLPADPLVLGAPS